MGAGHFEETKIPQQKFYDGVPFPYVVTPTQPSSSVIDLVESVKSEKPYLESLLHKSGALLFRGFQVNTPSEFNDVVEAFGYEELPYVGGEALRSQVVGRVYTANESPLHIDVGFHHEMCYLAEFPSKLFFFCEIEPAVGGETPLVLSHIVYKKMKEMYPDFVQRLEEVGLTSSRVLEEEDDPSNPAGRGWKSQFSTNDKKVAEERAACVGVKLEWLENGRVRTIRGPFPAIRLDKSRNRPIWFNSMAVFYEAAEKRKRMFDVTFGDGKPLPRDIVYDCKRILEEESVVIPWNKGDILLVDNLATLHGRKGSQSQLLSEVSIPQQRNHFPVLVSPPADLPPPSLPSFVSAVKEEKPYLDSLLRRAGAVLFRGFPVGTAAEFNAVVEAFGWEELPYVGGAAPRTNVVGRVFTANESPPDQKIPFHHEMAQV